jgi:hypothetical protein
VPRIAHPNSRKYPTGPRIVGSPEPSGHSGTASAPPEDGGIERAAFPGSSIPERRGADEHSGNGAERLDGGRRVGRGGGSRRAVGGPSGGGAMTNVVKPGRMREAVLGTRPLHPLLRRVRRCVRRSEDGHGFTPLMGWSEWRGRHRDARRAAERRRHRSRRHALPSPCSGFRDPERPHEARQQAEHQPVTAFIAGPVGPSECPGRFDVYTVAFALREGARKVATVDLETTLAPARERNALFREEALRADRLLHTPCAETGWCFTRCFLTAATDSIDLEARRNTGYTGAAPRTPRRSLRRTTGATRSASLVRSVFHTSVFAH